MTAALAAPPSAPGGAAGRGPQSRRCAAGGWPARRSPLAAALLLLAAMQCASAAATAELPSGLARQLAAHYGLPSAPSAASASWAALARVSRTLAGGGFHRTLEYDVAGLPAAAAAAVGGGACRVLLAQPLPPDLYADPYQLQELKRHSGGFEFELFGPLDLEQPAPACAPTLLALALNASAPGAGSWRARLTVPLHAKYPAPRSRSADDAAGAPADDAGYSLVAVPPPWLLTTCGGGDGAALLPPPPTAAAPSGGGASTTPAVTWRVPAGDLDDGPLVAAATAAAAAAAALVVLVQAMRWKDGSL